MSKIKLQWSGQGGFKQVLHISIPLIISTSAMTIQHFIDSVFLMAYSPDAMSASVQSGVTHYMFLSLFVGTVTYVNTFIAQYTGAKMPHRIGFAVWQGLYLSLLGAVLIMLLIPISKSLFQWFQHDPSIMDYEVIYFNYLCYASFPFLVSTAISAFYTGRGKTKIVMVVNILTALVNIILDYGLIFGKWGLPEWGFVGAARATLIATIFSSVVFLVLFFRKNNRQQFGTLSGAKPDWDLFKRLIRYGLPSGIQIMLEVLPFTLFIMFIGQIGKAEMAATTMAFRINMLAFLPMIGFGIGVTTLVGQALGQNKPHLAKQTTWSAASLTMGYMVIIAIGFVVVPDLFLAPFAMLSEKSDPQEFLAIKSIVKNLLWFVAAYCLFDTGNIIFAATLKGAGDTRYVMVTSVILNTTILIIPSMIASWMGWSIYVFWGFATLFICVLAVMYFRRYLTGKWTSMRVIEAVPPAIPVISPEVPSVEPESVVSEHPES